MITNDQLLERGYRKYNCSGYSKADSLYQTKREDTYGILYYLDFYEYDNRRFGSELNYSCQLHTTNADGNTIMIQISSNGLTLDYIEQFFATTWALLKCKYYKYHIDEQEI